MNIEIQKEDILAELGVNYQRRIEVNFDRLEVAIAYLVCTWPRDVGGVLAELTCVLCAHAELIDPDHVAAIIRDKDRSNSLPVFVWGALARKVAGSTGVTSWQLVAESIATEASLTRFSVSFIRPMSVSAILNGEDEAFAEMGIRVARQDLRAAQTHILPVEWVRRNLPLYAMAARRLID